MGDSKLKSYGVLVQRGTQDAVQSKRFGVEFQTQLVEIDGKQVKAQIWRLGHCRPRALQAVTSTYYKVEQRWRQRNGRKAEQSEMHTGREWDLRENRDGVRMGRERAGLRVSWRKKMSRDRGTESWREKFQKNGFFKVIRCGSIRRKSLVLSTTKLLVSSVLSSSQLGEAGRVQVVAGTSRTAMTCPETYSNRQEFSGSQGTETSFRTPN
ncbi:hypothetical protein FH972_005992 [Carpinus fangiana]|uniref:Uncharacterized protein n=1 Tax=Carpinus fangiana TaxID=176857 RepID=A0A5N6QQX9_9ROSI|nr:hypothetical protein FH972_005992 [Carpinus fangiana]